MVSKKLAYCSKAVRVAETSTPRIFGCESSREVAASANSMRVTQEGEATAGPATAVASTLGPSFSDVTDPNAVRYAYLVEDINTSASENSA